jgi:hypothetical protein
MAAPPALGALPQFFHNSICALNLRTIRIVFAYLLLRIYEFALRIYGSNSIFPRFDTTNCKLRAAASRWPSEDLGWRKNQ